MDKIARLGDFSCWSCVANHTDRFFYFMYFFIDKDFNCVNVWVKSRLTQGVKMMKQNVVDMVKQIIGNEINADGAFIPENSRLIDDLRVDSLSRALIYMKLEKEFGISLTEFIKKNTRVSDVCKRVRKEIAKKSTDSMFMTVAEYNAVREKYSKQPLISRKNDSKAKIKTVSLKEFLVMEKLKQKGK